MRSLTLPRTSSLGTAAALVVLLTAAPAQADNCSGLYDCFSTVRTALAAAGGLSFLALLINLGLDKIPAVRVARGLVEFYTGRDVVMGNELSKWERALGIVPMGIALAMIPGAHVAMGLLENLYRDRFETPRLGRELLQKIRKVNPGYRQVSGRSHNCAYCAISTDATLATGSLVTSMPLPELREWRRDSVSDVLQHFRRDRVDLSTRSIADVQSHMQVLPEGSRGIVLGLRGGKQAGHAFNVVKHRGEIFFIDGQTGRLARLDDGFVQFYLLETTR